MKFSKYLLHYLHNFWRSSPLLLLCIHVSCVCIFSCNIALVFVSIICTYLPQLSLFCSPWRIFSRYYENILLRKIFKFACCAITSCYVKPLLTRNATIIHSLLLHCSFVMVRYLDCFVIFFFFVDMSAPLQYPAWSLLNNLSPSHRAAAQNLTRSAYVCA